MFIAISNFLKYTSKFNIKSLDKLNVCTATNI
jgi:hypothetical protein